MSRKYEDKNPTTRKAKVRNQKAAQEAYASSSARARVDIR
jgi:hypothetical protein